MNSFIVIPFIVATFAILKKKIITLYDFNDASLLTSFVFFLLFNNAYFTYLSLNMLLVLFSFYFQ